MPSSTESNTGLFDVSGVSVVVTGGTRGIGLAIAEGFARAGAAVTITSRDREACRAAEDHLSAFGTARAIPADISTDAGRADFVETLRSAGTPVDVLVNNAGTLWAQPLDEYTEAGWDKVFNLNVRAAFFLTRDLLPELRAAATPARPARVINIGSVNGDHVPRHETYAYPASKAALHHLTRHLASKLAADSITVNVVAPGLYYSKMQQATVAAKGADAVLAAVPLARFAEASDMAGAAIFLASPAGSYITGAVIPVDGGMTTTI